MEQWWNDDQQWKSMKNLGQDSWCPGQNFNKVAPKYKSATLPPHKAAQLQEYHNKP
jgi:hypothetical protein